MQFCKKFIQSCCTGKIISKKYFLVRQKVDNEFNQRCLDIIRNANNEHIELRTKEFGPLVRGQAYSKKFNQYYEVIGFIVDNNIYLDSELKSKQKGLFAIYHSNCESTVPLIFERNFSDKDNSFNGKHFVAGDDTRVDIEDVICNKDLVNSYMNDTLIDRLANKTQDMSK